MNDYSPRDGFSSPEFSSERKAMRSPEFPNRPGHDPFGENYMDPNDAESDASSISTVGGRARVGLRREVTFTGCLSLVVGVMIGSGIFATPAVVFKYAGSPGMGLMSWVICGVICILASLCYIELGTMIPTSGGEKTYLSEAFGELAGFLYSWTAILIVKPAAIAGVSMAFANYVLEPFFPGCQEEHVYLMKMVASVGIELKKYETLSPYGSNANIEMVTPTAKNTETNKDIDDKNEAIKVEKAVGLLGGVSLIVGTMIGSGIFASASAVFQNANSAGMSLLVWTFAGVLSLLASLCYIELGTMIPRSGGEYQYLREAFGDIPAFLFSFSSTILLRPAGLAAVLLSTGDYIVEVFFHNECNDIATKLMVSKLLAALFLGIIVFVNCASVRWATSVQVIFTGTKLVAIVLLIVTGLVRLGQGHNDSLKNAFNGTSTSVSDIGYAFYGGLWAYDGWNNLNYVTEELKNPIRDLPLAIMIGIPLVTGCYVMVNIAYLTVLTSAQIATSNAVAVTLANQLYGVMAWIIPVFVACSTFGAANGSAFTSGRLVYVSAREGHMPKLLAMVHTKRHTPLPALIFTCIIAWIMLIPESSNFATLVNYFNFAAWTFYGGTVAALLWLRISQPDLKRPYKVFIGIPIVVLLCSLYLVIAPFYDYPLQSLYCLLFILFGIPVYFVFVKYQLFPKSITTGFDKLTYKIQMLCDLSMPDGFEEDQ